MLCRWFCDVGDFNLVGRKNVMEFYLILLGVGVLIGVVYSVIRVCLLVLLLIVLVGFVGMLVGV